MARHNQRIRVNHSEPLVAIQAKGTRVTGRPFYSEKLNRISCAAPIFLIAAYRSLLADGIISLKQCFNSDLFWLVTSQEAVVLHLVLMDLEDWVPRSVAMILVPMAAVMVVYLCNRQTLEQKQRGWLPTAIRSFSS